MNPFLYQFLSIDAPPLLTALFAALTCALLGNFLVLRQESLMGDAIAHSVLPGIVVGFLVSGSRSPLPVFVGAAVAGALSAMFIGAIKKLGNVETGAAMSVVFTLFFAIGILLMELAAHRNIDLDADCLLHGQLEHVFWTPPKDPSSFLSFSTLSEIPYEVPVSLATFLCVLLLVRSLHKELALYSFDQHYAAVIGFRPELIHKILLFTLAISVVVAFKVVGSILVIAMLICPAATARFFTDSLKQQLRLSLVFGGISAVIGYGIGAFAPYVTPLPSAVSASGMIAVVSGLLFALAFFFAPRYGHFSKKKQSQAQSDQMGLEDLLGLLYRLEEGHNSTSVSEIGAECANLLGSAQRLGRIVERAVDESLIVIVGNRYEMGLTEKGRTRAKELVRSHRLWESFLVDELGFSSTHVHERAHQLEHLHAVAVTDHYLETGIPKVDPHGRKIPKE
jgi:manganese/zinc/iron transport system permease protein